MSEKPSDYQALVDLAYESHRMAEIHLTNLRDGLRSAETTVIRLKEAVSRAERNMAEATAMVKRVVHP